MGVFNVSGTMSNISIGYGHKVVFIPLLPTNFDYSKESKIVLERKSMIVSNNGSAVYYSPRFLPIVGTYNDCGSIENIERDKNVEYIEKYFNISIEDFVDYLTVVEVSKLILKKMSTDKAEELLSLSGMFELYDVYKEMSKYNAEISSAMDKGCLSEYVLKKLGFILKRKKSKIERFYLVYKHPEVKDLEMHCDGNFSICYLPKENREFSLHTPQDLKEFCIEKKINLIDFKSLEGVSSKHILFEQHMETNLKKNNFLSLIGLNKNKIDSFLFSFNKMDYALNEDFKDAYIKLLNFNDAMFSTNKFYFPSLNGIQEGDYGATKKLAETTLNCIKNIQ